VTEGEPAVAPSPVRYRALAEVAFVTGAVAFGGGLAAIARLRRVVVVDRGWMDDDAFVERVGVAGALPGTMVTNLFVLVGYHLKGTLGALLSTLVFVVPGCGLISLLAVYYDVLHATSWVRVALDGLSPAVAGLFASVAVELGRSTLKDVRGVLVALVASVALATRWLTLLEVIALAGTIGALSARPRPTSRPGPLALAPISLAVAMSAPAWLVVFGVFARIGVATFGGGIAMVPAIEHEAIGRGWLDARTFADAVAFGQITPGPVATTATFVGWRAAGPVGALAATLGVFLPPTALALLAARSLAAFRENRVVQGFLRGIAPAVVGVMAAASFALGRASVHAWSDGAILLACVVVRLAWPRLNPLWPLGAGALAGVVRALAAGTLVL
jgi:chromate transporter